MLNDLRPEHSRKLGQIVRSSHWVLKDGIPVFCTYFFDGRVVELLGVAESSIRFFLTWGQVNFVGFKAFVFDGSRYMD